MYIFTTINDNFPEIWETSGIATFSSKFEGHPIYEEIYGKLGSEQCAIGIYRGSKGNPPQKFAPSLLRITGASLVPAGKHDIRITFIFLKKLSFDVDAQLRTVKKRTFPLIKKISEHFCPV